MILEPSLITNESFGKIERQLEDSLPSFFKEFYSSYYTLEKDFDAGVIIAGNRREDDLALLSEYFFDHSLSDNMRKLGLLPFGYYNDEWYVCLDMNNNKENPPIMLFEMSNYQAGADAISHRHWFSDFNSMLMCLSDQIKTESPDNFDRIDPGNNFLTAYDYWPR